MQPVPTPNTYVVAVSGGVDSVVLLHLLMRPDSAGILQLDNTSFAAGIDPAQLVVAHYDHGIRTDAATDREFVEQLAEQYGLEFYTERGNLGPQASEALARQKRYEFLRAVAKQTNAKGIITAHHQDDRLETALLNIVRGTGRRGLSSLRSNEDIVRPLLGVRKQDLLTYATAHQLTWHEDSTNRDERYLRNYLRRQIIPRFSPGDKAKFLALLDQATVLNDEINDLLEQLLQQHVTAAELDRQWFLSLPHPVAREVLLAWLRQAAVQQLSRKRVEQLVVLVKTLPRGKLVDVDAGFQLQVTAHKLALVPRER